jgi:hypothetical protein
MKSSTVAPEGRASWMPALICERTGSLKEQREYGTNGINGTNGRVWLPNTLPFVPFIPFVPYSL